ncbi:PREDICTED: leishmanolysin-like peptidase [Nicrophorus vespilloides]|uniref:Leishmanolysin-like peptidase n=1 Tax=Nicrophorus vespilloides TaxID=110193 RepID=A0ABM1N648_NICVS|nr:PREDICTED: leishmanolysin-like peptidase [Nicrophorus vespilloides]
MVTSRATLFCFSVFLYVSVDARTCNHFHPKHNEVVHGVHIESHHAMRKRSIDQSLRILLWYDESVYRLNDTQFELINNTILPQAVQYWEKALFVRKVENVIRLTRKCNETQVFVKDSLTHCIDTCKEKTMCGEVEVPESHLDACRVCNSTGQNCGIRPGSQPGQGIEGFDFVFYVSASQTERCNKSLAVAYAAHCQQETGLDRPIAGHANLCPNNISTKPQELETLLSTVKHEILHALGFSVSLYAFYRDEKGNPLTPRSRDTGKPTLNERLQTYQWSERVIKTVTRSNWMVRSGVMEREVQMIVTPQVVREVREYFNCSLLEGAELEDQGEEGTALTHWEKRVFENEAMTGTHTQNPVISRITLALMEDTGWYKANYSMAETLTWGRNLGCDFVMKSCKEWITTKSARGRSIHPFCNKVKRNPLQTECTDDRTSVALCNLDKHSEFLPQLYQNFDKIDYVEPGTEGFYGGSVSLADYCPYIQEFNWRSNGTIVRGSHCQFSENNPHPDKNFAFEKYGKHSRCFEHSNKMWEERSCREMKQWQHFGSGCYSYKCENGRLHIKVENYTYTCYHSKQEIAIRILNNEWLHKGAIICPPCRELCQDEFESRGESCKPGEEPSPSNYYPYDELQCDASLSGVSSTMFIFVLILITSVR